MKRAMRAAHQVVSAGASGRSPGRSTTQAMTSSSVSSLGTPYTTQLSTEGWASITCSTSAAEMFSPRRRTMSLRLPTKYR